MTTLRERDRDRLEGGGGMRQKTKTTPLQRGRASSPTGNGRKREREREMEDGEKRSKGAETRTVGRTRLKEGGREQGGGGVTHQAKTECARCVSVTA